jgi:prolipoprotein diacylglyceryltransferase
LTVGGLQVHTYELMLVVGFAAAIHLANRRAVEAGYDPRDVRRLEIVLLLAALAGGRLTYVVEDGERVVERNTLPNSPAPPRLSFGCLVANRRAVRS